MSFLALNLLLALVWVFLLAEFTFAGLLMGLAVGFVVIALGRPVLGSHRFVAGVFGTLRLLGGFALELFLANLHLAQDALRPKPPFHPAFLAFDARDLPLLETVFLGNLVSLTPGTVTVDMDEEGEFLYIHALYAADPEEVRAGVRRLANLIHLARGEPPVRPREKKP